jgi:hypothetical protein
MAANDSRIIFPVFSLIHEPPVHPELPPPASRLPNPAGLFAVAPGTREPEKEEQDVESLVDALTRIANALERIRPVRP